MTIHTSAELQEQRGQIRFVILLEAKAFPGDIACRIMDISHKGARLQFKSRVDLPDEFVVVEWQAGLTHACRIAWRRSAEVGVEFLSVDNLPDETTKLLGNARRAWDEASDRPITTFSVRQMHRKWHVTLSGPSLGEPAVVGTFLSRWKAQQFARDQAEVFRGRAQAVLRD